MMASVVQNAQSVYQKDKYTYHAYRQDANNLQGFKTLILTTVQTSK